MLNIVFFVIHFKTRLDFDIIEIIGTLSLNKLCDIQLTCNDPENVALNQLVMQEIFSNYTLSTGYGSKFHRI